MDRFLMFLKNKREFLDDVRKIFIASSTLGAEFQSVTDQLFLLDNIILQYTKFVKDKSDETTRNTQ